MNKNNLKKLLLVFITAVLGVMSFGLRAQTSYNFTIASSSVTISDGVIQTNASGHIVGMTGSVYRLGALEGTINNLYIAYDYLGPTTTTNPFFSERLSFGDTGYCCYTLDYGGGNYLFSDNLLTEIATVSSSAVPEIDGALIPQVGLLLAGLFIILGRRKENTESLLAV